MVFPAEIISLRQLWVTIAFWLPSHDALPDPLPNEFVEFTIAKSLKIGAREDRLTVFSVPIWRPS